MNYVDSLNLLGIQAKQTPCIKGEGVPTAATEGAVGCLYMNTLNGEMYKCISVKEENCEWVEFEGNKNGLITPNKLDLRDDWDVKEEDRNVEDITNSGDVTTEFGCYYSQTGDTVSERITNNTMTAVKISNLTSGDIIKFNAYPGATPDNVLDKVNFNYFVFLDDNDNPVIPVADISKYTSYDEGTEFYSATIPTGATKMYTTRLNIYMNTLVVVKEKKVTSETFNIGWLKIAEKNLPDNFYEKVADKVKDIENNEVTSDDSYLITHNPYGRIDFNNKSIVSYGDSITYGAGATNPYISVLATKYSMSLTNRAVNGTTIMGDDTNSINLLVTNNNDSDKDFIIIAGGTNDWTLGKALGSYGKTTNETVYGALDVICNHLKTSAPNAKVIFITPINRSMKGVQPIATLNAYRQAITETALKYGYAVVDGRQLGISSLANNFGRDVLKDGLHPTDLGHTVMCNSLVGILC